MAGSSSASMRDRVDVCLNEHRFIAYKLLESLSHASSNTTPTILRTTDSLFEAILKKDRVLLQTVKQLNAHQAAQKELDNIKAQIAEKEAKIVQYARELRGGQKAISNVLLKHRRVLSNAKASSTTSHMKPQDIIAYAHKVASTSSAPAGWQPGYPMFGFMPPAPTPEMMRAGVLSRGIIDSIVTKETSSYTSTKRSLDASSAGVPSAVGDVRIGLGISDEEISKLIPPGWKPGDPIDLPAEALVRLRGPSVFAEHGIEVPGHILKAINEQPIPPVYMEQLRAKLDEKTPGHVDKKPRLDDAPDEASSESSSSSDEGSDASDSESEQVPKIRMTLSDSEDDD
ncbi:hypothetical protein SPRG_14694 [Saprolegnia parasitica CBS 223.65]|uniref:Mediator of RNA polymerase II transcription subunit 4 n=1 Tax=Saprolegnia parasitica (strain CBS 223.65) TaxID=695850 RepID=A0A067BXL3_SAPPC|nr:hypothetical protein SPRG_14694 [Saprolegnia parasitica CBS 223.65]KDO19302.1 hypothetical protein SPRG_14694 [Saprolegnia parasitica CBS 223.65]|eukprot:XP_012209976.1 hypothetical protein SPRG_14694 [Saprolegnia parasitica CBS 223.65]